MEGRIDSVDRLSRLPLELKLVIWEILNDSIKSNYDLSAKQEVRCYGRLMLLNKEWFHTFAKKVYANEVQVATVLSNNLHDKSPENIRRIEDLYTCYVTSIERVGYTYHKNYRIFWECLEKFDDNITFPNLKTLNITTGKHLNRVPRIGLPSKIDKLLIYHSRDTPEYTVLREFCDHVSKLNVSIEKVIFSTRGSSAKLFNNCKPIFNCHIKCVVFNGYLSSKELDAIAANETCTSLSVRGFDKKFKHSPKLYAFFQRLKYLEWGDQAALRDEICVPYYSKPHDCSDIYEPGLTNHLKFPNVKTLRIFFRNSKLSKTFNLIPNCFPALGWLTIVIGLGHSEKQKGEELALALNNLDDNIANYLKFLRVGEHDLALDFLFFKSCISKTKWKRFKRLDTMELVCYESPPDNLHLLRSQIPAIQSIQVINTMRGVVMSKEFY